MSSSPKSFAEHQNDAAPEVVPQGAKVEVAQYYKPEQQTPQPQYQAYQPYQQQLLPKYDPNFKEMAPGDKKKDRILGMRRPVFFGLLLALIIVIAVAVAVPLSITQKNKSSSSSSNAAAANAAASTTTSATITGTATTTGSTTATGTATKSSSATSSAASSSPTALTMISANWGGTDITEAAESVIPSGPNLVVNMDPLPLPDPWYGNKKCLSMLYNFGYSIRTFVECDFAGVFTLEPGPVNTSNSQVITRQGPTSSNFALVSVVWGAAEIRDADVYQSLFNYKNNGSALTLSNQLFGNDTLFGTAKSGVIWYTQDSFKTFKVIYGREGDTITF